MKKSSCSLLILVLLWSNGVFGQDLLNLLEAEQKDENQYAPSAFMMTRIAFGHSTEVRPQNVLDVFVANRFWNTPEESTQSFVADRMSSRIALEYAISDRLTFGAGATTFDGLFDAHLKYRAALQRNGDGWPITLTLFQNMSYDSSPIADQSVSDDFSDRLSFTSQILVSKRFNKNFSLQLAPTLVNRSLGLSAADPTSIFALGAGVRYKLGPHVSFVSEYYQVFNPLESRTTFDPIAFGVNWELGDLMLQFMLTNSWFMVEDAFITRTPNNFNFRNPNLNFGFNATYVIHFKNKLKK
ncbi:MAG: hypothetical protein ED555_10710 [Allomuricauda sp.]|nr:MAG: hypothetical protein ED555_10710 [Allomuricauda sp.]